MIDVGNYLSQLIHLLRCEFSERLLYVGLQGSYVRGEASDRSDLDVMVVIDELSVSDLDCYRRIIQSMEHSEKSCGFICSKADIANWNPLEMGHLLHSTKDYYGVLRELVPAYTQCDIRNFVKLSLNNLYHEICHRYVHAQERENVECLPGAYKGVFFILQNLYYLKLEKFAATKAELLGLLEGKDRTVLERSIELGNGTSCDFAYSFELLFTWCQETLKIV